MLVENIPSEIKTSKYKFQTTMENRETDGVTPKATEGLKTLRQTPAKLA